MAVLSGFLTKESDLEYARYNLTSDFDLYDESVWINNILSWEALVSPGATTLTTHWPVSTTPFVKSGGIVRSYFDDYYNRIHVIPSSVDFGNVLSVRDEQITVWNAYIESKTLTSVDTPIDQNIAVDVITPLVFTPLREVTFTFQATTDGPFTISGFIDFVFVAATTFPIAISGSRLIVWRAMPDWTGGMSESFEWLTDVMSSYNRTEQRVLLRTLPRRTFEFESVAPGNNRLAMQNDMRAYQGKTWGVPLWTDGGLTQQDAIIGEQAVYLDTANRQYYEGGLACLISDDGVITEPLTITLVQPDMIIVADPLIRNWAKGSRILPLKIGKLAARQEYASKVRHETRLKTIFDIEGEDDGLWSAAELGQTYSGYPMLEQMQHNWVNGTVVEVDYKQSEYDYLTGKKYFEDEAEVVMTYDVSLALIGKDKITNFKNWLHARKGRYSPFWMETPDESFIVKETIPANVSNLLVKIANVESIGLKENRTHFKIEYMDGTSSLGYIIDVEKIDDYTEKLYLNAALASSEILPSQIRKASFLTLVRLHSDTIDIAWVTPEYAKVKFKVTEVINVT